MDMTPMEWRNESDADRNNTSNVLTESSDPFQPLYSGGVLIAFTVAYAVILLVGLCGNVSTCLVVLRRQYVHSQTPFYLNLAFSDLLLLIAGFPVDVYFFWCPYQSLGGTWFCIARAVVLESATNASILTIVYFTAERWISISKSSSNFPNTPATNGRFGQGKNGRIVIMVIWLTSFVAAVPLSAQLGLMPIMDPQTGLPIPDTGLCHVVPERALPYSFEASSLIFFVIPMIMITMFYSSIIVQLRRTVAKQSSVNDSPLMHVAGKARQQAKASGAVVKILSKAFCDL